MFQSHDTMKKFLQLLTATVFAWVFAVSTAQAQCPNDNVFFFGYSAPTTIGASVGSEVCIYAGEYYLISNMVAGSTYRISSCGSPDIVDTRLTIYANSGGSALAFNDDFCGTRAQLDFTPATTGSYRILLDQTGPGNTCTSTTSTFDCGEVVVTLISSGPSTAYCVPQYAVNGGTTNGDFINRVAIGSINNANSGSEGGPSYTDYSNLSTNLLPNTEYVLTIQNNPDFTENVAAWIDYNGDLTFSLDEKLGQNVVGAGATTTITFTTPTTVNAGETRLRVRMAFTIPSPGGQMDPCALYQFGEAEDYRVVFPSDPPGPPGDLQFSTICGLNTTIQDNACPNFTNASVTVSGLSNALGTTHRISSVDLIIEHALAADLDLFLEGPNGSSVELSTDNGNGGSNYGSFQPDNCTQFARFSMSASTPIAGGTAPFVGSFIPEGDLNSFNTAAINPNGIWRLRACDDFAGDIGVIRYFRVNFELIQSEPPACAESYNLADALTGVPVDQQITWVAGAGSPSSYDVYFGTSATPGIAVQGQSETSFNPGTLVPSTTYFYQIVPVNSAGPAVGCPVRSFTTADNEDVILMTNGSISTCEGIFTDAGGSNGNYFNSDTLTFTIFPGLPNSSVQVDFTSFQLETGFDILAILDGVDENAPIIGFYLGSDSPGTVTATNPQGALTFVFLSDEIFNETGWTATVSCIPNSSVPECATNLSPSNGTQNVAIDANLSWSAPSGTITGYDVYFGTSAQPPLVASSVSGTSYDLPTLDFNTQYYYQIVPVNSNGAATGCAVNTFFTQNETQDVILMQNGVITTCSGLFFDSGGQDGDYSNGESFTLTVLPETPNSLVSVTFNTFNTDPGFDLLTIYNGTTTNFTPISSLGGSSIQTPFTITSDSPDGALTFTFSSDFQVTSAGWSALLSCIDNTGAPNCATNLTPADGATGITLNTELSWSSGGGAPLSYDVFFGTDAQNLTLIADNNVDTDVEVGPLVQGQTYFWQVVPSNGNGDAIDCPISSFTATSENQILMTTDTITACNATLYDSGGPNGSYGTLELSFLTILPETPGTFVQANFTAFDLEQGFDILAIVNGTDPNNVDEVIGFYTGSESPGTVTSTSSDGALTFVFLSDEIDSGDDGWAANITCVNPADSTVWDVIVNSEVHNTLETLVNLANLDEALQGPGPLTVFAPTDAAFQLLPQAVVDALLADPTGALTQVLLYHVVGGLNLSSSLSDGQQIITLNGQSVTVTINGNDVFINDAQVIIADILADNGVVHVIDAVLVPEAETDSTVWSVIVNSEVHNTLETLVTLANLDEALQGPGPLTVFAPTDAAFQLLPQAVVDALLADPTGALTQILLYHVVGGLNLSSSLSDGQQIVTLNGETVTVTIVGNDVFINDAQVIIADILADNGVVHVIDAVLVPEEEPVTDILMQNGSITACEGNFFDTGGANGNYLNNELLTLTITPSTPNSALQVNFSQFATEAGFDFLTIFDGNSTASPEIGEFSGTTSPGIITSTASDGSLTFVFDSDGSVSGAGWAATLSCIDLSAVPACATNFLPADNATDVSLNATLSWSASSGAPVTSYDVFFGTEEGNLVLVADDVTTTSFATGDLSANTTYFWQVLPSNANGPAEGCDVLSFTTGETTDINMFDGEVTTCSANFFDSAGPSANYANGENLVLVVNPAEPNSVVQVNFSAFNTEAGFDFLTIYDGVGTAGQVLSDLNGILTTPIVVTSLTGSLTFEFGSDGSVNRPGWSAFISCVDTTELPGCAQVVAPVEGAQDVSASGTTLSWTQTTGVVTGYNVLFGSDCNSLVLVSENQSGTTFTTGPLETGTSYAWQIVPLNNNGTAEGCGCNTFTTDPNIDIIMSNSSVQTCAANFYDSGNIGANYANGENFTLTITPDQPNSAVEVTFNSFNTEGGFDFLAIFDGNSTAAPQIANLNGILTTPFSFVSSAVDGSLTFQFTSDGSVNRPGWSAEVACVPTGEVPACAENFFPADGATDVAFNPTLTWSTGGGIVSGYDVFFGTDPDNLALASEGQTGTSFSPGTLDLNTTYYWQVVPVNQEGPAVGCPVLSFTTQQNAEFVIFNGEVTLCEGTLFDTGGSEGGYQVNEDITLTIFPSTPGSFVQLDFNSFAVEEDFDFLNIYNGNSAAAPLIVAATGAVAPATIISTSADGSLTLNFSSDFIINDAGFEIAISCFTPAEAPSCATGFFPADAATDVPLNAVLSWTNGPGAPATGFNVFFGTDPDALVLVGDGVEAAAFTPDLDANTTYFWQIVPFNTIGSAEGCPVISFTTGGSLDVNMFNGTVTTCNANFFDSAGPDANYANGENLTLTFFPDQANASIQVNFNAFTTEVNFDALYVYDGPDINSPQIASANGAGFVPGGVAGGFWGGALPGPFTSSHPTGALTFVFRSDGSVTNPGWSATVTCIDASLPPGCPVVTAPANGATEVSPTNAVFSWTPGEGVSQFYDVFFGTDCDNLVLVSDNQTGTTFNPGQLDLNTTYVWSVVAINANGESEACACNSFTTSGNIDILMSNAQISTCAANFYDSGGLAGAYLNNENFTLTISPDQANSAIQVFFTAFNTEPNFDGLYVYDGPDINSPQIASANGAGFVPGGIPGSFWGTVPPGPFTSTHPTGALTFVFRSDGSVTRPGWEALVSCVSTTEAPACATITAGPADGATDICINEAQVAWTPSPGSPATGYDVYFEIDGSGFVLLADNQTTLSFDPGVLQPNTTYSYIIVPTNANGDAVGCDTITFTTGTCLNYCDAGATICDEFIADVQMGAINNPSGCGLVAGYSDYTAISTDVFIGNASTITVTNGTLDWPQDQAGIWIDWNQDGDFNDANEAIAVNGTPGTGPYTANIIPPADAVLGPTRMRVRITFTGIVDPCGTTTFGEVEDYTVIVNPALACPFPNNIAFTETTTDATIVTWDPAPDATEYLIRYRSVNEDESVATWSVPTVVIPPDNFTFFLGLEICTDYLVQIASLCPNGTDTVYSPVATFQTRCIVCEPEFTSELEPCGQDLNGGCNSTPPSYEPIQCGQTICGTSFMNGSTRDTDWYELVVTNAGVYTVNVLAEFDGTVLFVDVADCANLVVPSQANFTAAQPFTFASTLTPGTYAVVLVPSFEQPIFDCNGFNAYTLELSGGTTQIAPVADVCETSEPITLFAIPSGGTWSGTGITDENAGTFDPSVAGIGSFEITYNASSNGCASSATATINVVAAPPADFVGLASTYCPADADVQLSGIPAGGSFSINTANNVGINGNVFSPSAVGAGTYEITYTVNTNGACAASITQTVTVNTAPQVSFSLADSTCSQDEPIALTATPASGLFSGAGVVGNTFDPSLAGTGAVVVTYTYTEAGQACPGVATETIQVNAAPVVTLSGLASEYCLNSEAVTLVGTPSLGSFSGPGVTGNVFDASAAGLGQHVIRYEFDNGTCVGFDEITVTVTENLSVTVNAPSTVCSDADPFVLTSTPSGAIFSGPGVNGGTFSPAVAGVGTHTITATLVNGSCVATSTQTITVNPAPVASFNYSANGANVVFVNASVNASSYSWDFGDNTTSTAVNPTHTYTANGAYTITLIASSQACGADTFSVDLELSVGIGSIDGVDMIQLYPNPTHGDVNLTFNSLNAQSFEVRITDATGRLIRSESMTNYLGKFNKVYDISDLARGMYNFTVSSEKGAVTFRVVRH